MSSIFRELIYTRAILEIIFGNTSMKRIYFIRHGITQGNETNSYQRLDTPLSETGRKQAQILAKRLTTISFDVLIASTMQRAQETAHIIASVTGHEVVSEHLFHEILRASIVRGKAADDPEAIEALRISRSLWTDKHKKHGDEGNFYDIKNRAIKALDFLASRKEEKIVVVTHGTILKMIIAAMIRGEELDPEFREEINTFFFTQNTGITTVEYDNEYHPKRWQLITWNDHAHLG